MTSWPEKKGIETSRGELEEEDVPYVRFEQFSALETPAALVLDWAPFQVTCRGHPWEIEQVLKPL
ncbi:MAG: hypothetical protein NZ577_03225 [Vicinamibacterales bacterium]|nr:hypothetical protein [Vicinamibacterales bacterium]